MSFLRKIIAGISSFFSSQETEHSEPLLPKIDPEKIKKKLDLQNEAIRNGQSGIPRHDSTQMTSAEHSIRAEVGRMREQTVKFGEQRNKQIQNRLDSIDVTLQINRAIELGNEFVRSSDQHLSREAGRRKDYSSEAKTKFQILTDFRNDNHLPSVPAIYPSGGNLFFKVATLFFCCVLEGGVNAVFFGSGLEDGLLGGFAMAFMLSAINVAICSLAGFEFRQKNHVKPFRRLFGWMSLGGAVMVILSLGVLISYFRYVLTVLEDGTQNPFLLVKQSLLAGVFPVQDFESLILFLGTVLFGGIAFWKGYGFSDPYPGYARVWRQYAEAHGLYIELVDDLRTKLEIEKADVLEKIDAGVHEADKDIKVFRYNMNQKSIVKKQVSETLVMADETLAGLTRFYQNENMMARPQGALVPAYFDDPVVFAELDMPVFDIEQDEARLAKQEQKLHELIEQVEPIRARVQSSFTQQHDQLQPLQELV